LNFSVIFKEASLAALATLGPLVHITCNEKLVYVRISLEQLFSVARKLLAPQWYFMLSEKKRRIK